MLVESVALLCVVVIYTRVVVVVVVGIVEARWRISEGIG